jgi:hypothetical protein
MSTGGPSFLGRDLGNGLSNCGPIFLVVSLHLKLLVLRRRSTKGTEIPDWMHEYFE